MVILCKNCKEKFDKESWMESKGYIGEVGDNDGALYLYQCPRCKTIEIDF